MIDAEELVEILNLLGESIASHNRTMKRIMSMYVMLEKRIEDIEEVHTRQEYQRNHPW